MKLLKLQAGHSETLQEVTDNGNTTTNSITFAGGTSTGRVILQDDLRINGAGGNPLQGVVRLYVDSSNTLNIDSGNNGTNIVVCFKYQDVELQKHFLTEKFSFSQ